MPRAIPGERYGRLTTIEPMGKLRNNIIWLCQCDCGNQTEVITGRLRSGTTKSCGCLRRERLSKHKHRSYGKTSSTYYSWEGMRRRCNNPKSKDYKYYGGRGIKVCGRWSKFENFLVDMGERPEGMTLDRKHPNGDYHPNNCRWATPIEQRHNRRDSS